MKRRSFKIGHLPKYEGGGLFDSDGDFDLASFMKGISGAIPTSQPESPELAEFQAKFGSGAAKANQITDLTQTGISAIPGWGQLAAAGMEIGQQIGKATKDEYGIYKSKGAEVIDNVLNPNTLVSRLTGNYTSQKDLRHARDVFNFENINEKAAQNQTAGAMVKNSLPVYKAPAYGEDGLKLRVGKRYSSKFSNFK